MIREQQPALSFLAAGLMGIGVLSVISRGFAYDWQPVPQFQPGREALAVACGLLTIAISVALLFRPTVAIATRALLALILSWQFLKIPAIVMAPRTEVSWLSFGQMAMLLAGAWTLFACLSGLDESRAFRHLTGPCGLRGAQMLFGLALLPVGLSHLVYFAITVSLVPAWLPFHALFAWLTGLGQMACGLGLLLWIWPRAAALIEAGLLTLFAIFVWSPATWFSATPVMAGTPTGYRYPLTNFIFTLVLAVAALLIAANLSPSQSPWRRRSHDALENATPATPAGGRDPQP